MLWLLIQQNSSEFHTSAEKGGNHISSEAMKEKQSADLSPQNQKSKYLRC